MMNNLDNEIIRANALFTEGKYTEALRIYDEGVKAGHTRAIFNYAYCLQYGYGIDPDPSKAFELYTYLRYEEEGDAAYNAGAMLVTGRGVPCDPAEGYAYMLTAAECGCIEAQLYLAMVRLTGCVGEPDIISIRRMPFHRPDTPDSAFLLPPTPDENGEYADELMDKRFEIVEADEYEAIRYIRKAIFFENFINVILCCHFLRHSFSATQAFCCIFRNKRTNSFTKFHKFLGTNCHFNV